MAQFLSLVIDRHMSIDQAILQPRIHAEQNGELSMESDQMDPAVINYLEGKGYRIKPRGSNSFYMGAIHAALRRQNGSGFQGAADIRRDGSAMGKL
jgi:gamma-glutamyltranspeptidase/glutathione hydrolase